MSNLAVGHFKHVSFSDPQDNILYDDVLLSLAEQGLLGNTLRIWESPVYFIVLGRTGKVEEDLHLPAIKTDAIPVLRRSSGGGTVVQGPGCLNFSFIIAKDSNKDLNDLRKSYRIISERVLALLKNLGIDATFRPISDLALVEGDKKFSGNAQRRGRQFILHHGTILYDFNLSLVSRYLAIPRDIPEYRKGRTHLDFIANLPLTANKLLGEFKKTYTTSETIFSATPTSHEKEQLEKFLELRSPLLSI